MKRYLRGVAGLLVWAGSFYLLQAQSEGEPKALFEKVLGSTLKNDYSALVTVCDEGMKEMVTPDMLADLNRSLLVRFKGGYTPVYMGYLDKQGARVHYWKIVLKDQGDDMLMSLAVRQQLVSAFNLK